MHLFRMGFFGKKKKKEPSFGLPPIPDEILARVSVRGDKKEGFQRAQAHALKRAYEQSARDRQSLENSRTKVVSPSPFVGTAEVAAPQSEAGGEIPAAVMSADEATIEAETPRVSQRDAHVRVSEDSSLITEAGRTSAPPSVPEEVHSVRDETPAEFEPLSESPIPEAIVLSGGDVAPATTPEGRAAAIAEPAPVSTSAASSPESFFSRVFGSKSASQSSREVSAPKSGSTEEEPSGPVSGAESQSEDESKQEDVGPFLHDLPPEVQQIEMADRIPEVPNVPQGSSHMRLNGLGVNIHGGGNAIPTSFDIRALAPVVPEHEPLPKYNLLLRLLLWFFIVAAGGIVLFAGGYQLYLHYREVLFVPVEPVIPVLPPQNTPHSRDSTPLADPIFALDGPNYFPLSVERVTAVQVQEEIRVLTRRVRENGIEQAVEFIPTDDNNIPVAFSRFVILAQMGLPEEIVSLSDESFSFFVYVDNGEGRTGLAINLKPDLDAASLIRRHETALPQGLRAFMPERFRLVRNVVFRTGEYKGQAVRYFNIAGLSDLSVDYTVRGGVLYVATSKNTLRAIVDKKSG